MAPTIWLKLGRHHLPHDHMNKHRSLLIGRKNRMLINISFVAAAGSVPAEAPYQIILVHTKPPYKILVGYFNVLIFDRSCSYNIY